MGWWGSPGAPFQVVHRILWTVWGFVNFHILYQTLAPRNINYPTSRRCLAEHFLPLTHTDLQKIKASPPPTTHTRTHTCTHARTHAHTHTHARAHTHTHTPRKSCPWATHRLHDSHDGNLTHFFQVQADHEMREGNDGDQTCVRACVHACNL